jgi:hypothetical protein
MNKNKMRRKFDNLIEQKGMTLYTFGPVPKVSELKWFQVEICEEGIGKWEKSNQNGS